MLHNRYDKKKEEQPERDVVLMGCLKKFVHIGMTKKKHHVTRERRGAYGLFKEVCTYIGGSQLKKKANAPKNVWSLSFQVT
jgi:hypothetical protein